MNIHTFLPPTADNNQHNDDGHYNNSSNSCPCYYEDIAVAYKNLHTYMHS